ncbi:MAG: DUF2061 domain-containing protein [Myxococcota bacterium]
MESHWRTAAKTLSWRMIAAVITGGLAWAATGSIEAGLAMGMADTLVKLFVYYAHERAWARISAGYRERTADSPPTEVAQAEL